MGTIPYIWKKENESVREKTRKPEDWYMQQGVTGAEAMRACQLALIRWHKERPNDDYVKYLADALSSDYALYFDFAIALEEMMDERTCAISTLATPRGLPGVDWEDCTCCDECKWGPKRKKIGPWSTGVYIPDKKE